MELPVLKECPPYTTHCYNSRQIETQKLIGSNCDMFYGKEITGCTIKNQKDCVGSTKDDETVCKIQNGIKTCKCVDDGCNDRPFLNINISFVQLYLYVKH